jgi:hypothetical protein
MTHVLLPNQAIDCRQAGRQRMPVSAVEPSTQHVCLSVCLPALPACLPACLQDQTGTPVEIKDTQRTTKLPSEHVTAEHKIPLPSSWEHSEVMMSAGVSGGGADSTLLWLRSKTGLGPGVIHMCAACSACPVLVCLLARLLSQTFRSRPRA